MTNTMCPHCGSAYEASPDGLCPACGQALALPPSEADGWFPYHPTERLFQGACAALLAAPQDEAPSSRGSRWRWFLVSLGLFALALLAVNGAAKVGILVGVLLFHELGHFLGMRLFGYRDVSLFFIPLLGAAVTGSKERAPVWEQVVVLLLGPLPGLVLGSLLWVGLLRAEHPMICEAAGWLIALNLLNLAPLEPLDGGRLMNLLLFYRHPRVEAAALAASALGLAAVGEFVFGSWLLVGVGVLILLSVPGRYATARAAVRLAEKWPGLPGEVRALSQAQLRDTFREALRAAPKAELPGVVQEMRAVHERAAVPPLGPLPKAGFLALIAAAVGFTFYTGAYEAVPRLVLARPSGTSEGPAPEQREGPAMRRPGPEGAR